MRLHLHYLETPGVRCVDVNIAMNKILSDDGGEDIELQDLGQGDDLGDEGVLNPSLSIEEEPTAEDNLQTGNIEDIV